MIMQNSGGGGGDNKVHYGLCESSEFLLIEESQKYAILDFLSLLYKSKVTP